MTTVGWKDEQVQGPVSSNDRLPPVWRVPREKRERREGRGERGGRWSEAFRRGDNKLIMGGRVTQVSEDNPTIVNISVPAALFGSLSGAREGIIIVINADGRPR